MRWRGLEVAFVIIAVSLIALELASDFLVDLLWFSTVGYRDVFWTIFGAKAILFLAVFLVSAVSLFVSGTLAFRFAQRRGPWFPAVLGQGSATVTSLRDTLPALLGPAFPLLSGRVLIVEAAVVLGILIAIGETGNWDVALQFIHQASYGESDPLYGKDIGFYLFSLPAYVALKDWMLATLVFSALMAGGVYWARGDIALGGQHWWMSPAVAAHGSVLLGLFFAVKAWSYGLDRFLLLYGDNGVVVGAGYTDIHVALPILCIPPGAAALS